MAWIVAGFTTILGHAYIGQRFVFQSSLKYISINQTDVKTLQQNIGVRSTKKANIDKTKGMTVAMCTVFSMCLKPKGSMTDSLKTVVPGFIHMLYTFYIYTHLNYS